MSRTNACLDRTNTLQNIRNRNEPEKDRRGKKKKKRKQKKNYAFPSYYIQEMG